MISTRPLLLLTLALTGCVWGSQHQQAKLVEPALPKSIGRMELVEFLNQQNQGLQSWRCMNTKVHVKMPGLPLPQKLSGSLACSAPSQFRLVSDNMIAHADFGSNGDICWSYIQPGDSTVLTWKHEDSHLLQHLPGGLPRLEPDWLMTVLGVQPLDASRYELQNAPSGSREVWLVAVENSPDGTSLRRVIKVDTVLGVVREHALYDNERRALLRAHLCNHKSCGGHRLPHTVRIQFPQCETELTLNFTGIETDCQIADSLWNPPQGKNIEVVDLGDVMRMRMERDPEFRRQHQMPPVGISDSKSAEIPDQVLLDGVPSPEQEKGRSIPGNMVSFPGAHNDDRLVDSEPVHSEPEWDEDFGAIANAESFEPDESFADPREEPLMAPEFDVVTRPQRPTRRRSWLPFSRNR